MTHKPHFQGHGSLLFKGEYLKTLQFTLFIYYLNSSIMCIWRTFLRRELCPYTMQMKVDHCPTAVAPIAPQTC